VTTAAVTAGEVMLTVVLLRPTGRVVHPGLAENVMTVSVEVESSEVPDAGVTASQGTVGAVTAKKIPEPELMVASVVPLELQTDPCVQVRLIVGVTAVMLVACREVLQTVNANSPENI
jgi:hypothetical protein